MRSERPGHGPERMGDKDSGQEERAGDADERDQEVKRFSWERIRGVFDGAKQYQDAETRPKGEKNPFDHTA